MNKLSTVIVIIKLNKILTNYNNIIIIINQICLQKMDLNIKLQIATVI